MPNVLTRIGVAMGPWFHRKIVDPLLQILRRGAEPKQLSFSAALGISLGVFPICGVTVFLCAMAIAVLGSRCHAPTVMLANFIATPIELSLVVPFLRLGEVISGGPHFPLTSDALKKVLTGQASREILYSILNALLGWLVAAPFILGVLHLLLLPCCKILVCKFSTAPSSPKKPLSAQIVRKLSSAPSSPNKALSSHTEVRLKVRDV
ncbi:uncharacterized protein LOC131309739 [Rhododendron vialii]|uniref:uncharacterized protein LOC131309739 n=1 Tax=Rhododendron vialii TaxID=182163 RepID=UPI00265F3111|nr:uncharacterized protein LOC131309739 [Rhododendron vialii]